MNKKLMRMTVLIIFLLTIQFIYGQNIEMVFISGGVFTMGSPGNEVNRNSDEFQRQITLGPFFIGKYTVTQAEYERIMGKSPSRFKKEGDNLPVENVTWFDAIEFCNKLSELEKLTPVYAITGTGNERTVSWNRNANGFRLPTEAEWEYSCRAGTNTAFNTGNNVGTYEANYDGKSPYNNNAAGAYIRKTVPVGSYQANEWGLYDMHGNVWEWCWDWYGNYAAGAQTNPIGPASGTYRVLRGGSWFDGGRNLRSAARFNYYPGNRNYFFSFRIARS
ncbi:MAG: formylglycine-generating enzyme family protein [Treponema sp.]|nr:formylglycine-generating enzyme family protein [Treponema sp.]